MFENNLKYIKNIIWILIHCLFTYTILIISLISNDIRILTSLLIIMSLIKFLFYFNGRCMVTELEENDLFNNSSELFGNTIIYKAKNKDIEEILINMGNTIIIQKIFILAVLKFYKITFFD